MSDQDNMFNGTGTTETPTKEEPTNQVPEFLQEWVGEGKKYHSLDDALKSIPAAQSHIEKLENEAKSRLTEEQLNERNEQLMADLEEKLMKQMATKTTRPAVELEFTQTKETDQSVDIDSVVNSILSRREQEQSAKQNQMSVVASAVAKWGERAESTLYGEAAKLGLSPQQLDAFAAQNPKAVFKMLGIEDAKPSSTRASIGSTINTQSGVGGARPMPDAPASFDLWGNDDYLAKHVRDIEAHMISTGEIPST